MSRPRYDRVFRYASLLGLLGLVGVAAVSNPGLDPQLVGSASVSGTGTAAAGEKAEIASSPRTKQQALFDRINLAEAWTTEASIAKKEEVAFFLKTVDQYRAKGAIPAEQMDIIKELSAIVQYKQASIWAALYSRAILQSAMEDGRISEQEKHNLVSIRDLLRKNKGNLGVVACGKYLNDNPQVKAIFESMAKNKQR